MPAPVVNGVVLPLPNSAEEAPAFVLEEAMLASGKIVRYNRGTRHRIAYSWRLLTAAELAALRQAVPSMAPVVVVDLTGIARTMLPEEPPSVSPVAATDPVRYDASVAFLEQTPL